MALTLSNSGGLGGLTLTKTTNVVGSLSLTSSPYTSPIISYVTDGLVIDLDAGNYSGVGNWLDQTSNSNDAIPVQTPTFSSNDGGYFDLNGGFYLISGTGNYDSFAISDDSTIDTMDSISIEMWINIDTIQGITNPNLLFSKRTLTSNGYVGFFTSTGYVFRFGTSSTSQLTWTTTPLTNSWQQLIITVGSSGSKIYQNGTEVRSDAYTGNFSNINTNASLLLGDINPSSTTVYSFDGKIGVTRLYNRVISIEEVEQNFDFIRNRYGI